MRSNLSHVSNGMLRYGAYSAGMQVTKPHDQACTDTANEVEALPGRIGISACILDRAPEMCCEVSA